MFSHLHCHFTGSYSDSSLKIRPAVEKAARDGQRAIALADHGEMPAFFEFIESCHAARIAPIPGAELYFVPDAAKAIEKNNNDRYHLVALAKNRKGIANLIGLLSESWVRFSFKERRGLVDWSLLEKYHEGLIILSGCYYNYIAQALSRRGMDAAMKIIYRYKDIFGDDFYMEVGRHGIDEEEKVVAGLIELAHRCSMIPVLTNDAHYQDAADWIVHDVIIKTRVAGLGDYRASSKQYWLKTVAEMEALGFPREYLYQSMVIAEQIEPVTLPAVPAAAGNVPVHLDPAALISRGEAAYVSRMVMIDHASAERHVADVFPKGHPEQERIMEAITGIPRRSEPDTCRIACTPGEKIGARIPLKRSRGMITTQWDEASCRRAGAMILPAAHPSKKK